MRRASGSGSVSKCTSRLFESRSGACPVKGARRPSTSRTLAAREGAKAPLSPYSRFGWLQVYSPRRAFWFRLRSLWDWCRPVRSSSPSTHSSSVSRAPQQGGRTTSTSDPWYHSCFENHAPMFRHAIAAVLLVGLLLQPLSAAVCTDECESHGRQQSSEAPAEHCAEETRDSPGPPKHEKPTHDGSNCGHSQSICAVLQAQSPELPAPLIALLAILPPPPSALLGTPVPHSTLVRQSTSPSGRFVRITPLRI